MTIAEVGKKYGLSADTLRYYERIGLIPSIRRAENGRRNYTEDDCNWVEFIRCMRNAGVKVGALVEYVALFQQGDSTHAKRKQILIEQQKQLTQKFNEIKDTLNRLNYKIENYDKRLVPVQRKLTPPNNERKFL
ncbi:MAG: MerR family transcriptional regulator [Planctomycetaceae bacterium]|nr:MerR family transcriptional regulator [Planctomycetaceae bacterium]